MDDRAHEVYLRALQRMTPGERLKKAIEMGEFARRLFEQGLRKRFPELSEEAFRKLLRERLDLCHNRNY